MLKGRKAITTRPGAKLAAADIEATRQHLEKQTKHPVADREVVTHLLYPRVYEEFLEHQARCSDVSVLPTPANWIAAS